MARLTSLEAEKTAGLLRFKHGVVWIPPGWFCEPCCPSYATIGSATNFEVVFRQTPVPPTAHRVVSEQGGFQVCTIPGNTAVAGCSKKCAGERWRALLISVKATQTATQTITTPAPAKRRFTGPHSTRTCSLSTGAHVFMGTHMDTVKHTKHRSRDTHACTHAHTQRERERGRERERERERVTHTELTHTNSHTHTHRFTHTYTHTHSHGHTHGHTHGHSHGHGHSHAHTHTFTRSHTRTHTRSHAHGRTSMVAQP